MNDRAFRSKPDEADWARASDVLNWLYKVTGDDDVRRVNDLLDRTMRELP